MTFVLNIDDERVERLCSPDFGAKSKGNLIISLGLNILNAEIKNGRNDVFELDELLEYSGEYNGIKNEEVCSHLLQSLLLSYLHLVNIKRAKETK